MKILSAAIGLILSVSAQAWTEHFTFESIPNPPGVDPQVGGMDLMPDGRIAVAFHRGEVMVYDPSSNSWSPFANGLHEPLGLLVEEDGSMVVMQRAELTKLQDTDGDGLADLYRTLFDDFGLSGNYHEFAFGPVKDAEGNYYISLNVASNGAPIREEIRGEFSKIGKLNRKQMTNPANWSKRKAKADRMYSRVPYRGWILKISPDGSSMEPFASGFRSPDGIGFDAKGRLLATDNQGDWKPTSPLYFVEKGNFYGHPASLVWKEGWNRGDPISLGKKKLKAMKTPAIGYFPQGELANSPTQPLVVPEGVFPSGMNLQTIVGEMNQPNLIRVLEDEVNGKLQVGLAPLFDKSPLKIGNHRMVFGNDGSLYIGKTGLSWPGDKGFSKIKWKGTDFPYLEAIKATAGGLDLTFSQAIDEKTIDSIAAERHDYSYHSAYGSRKMNLEKLKLKTARLSGDGKTLSLDFGGLKKGFLHAMNFTKLRSAKGEKILGGKVWYQANEVPK